MTCIDQIGRLVLYLIASTGWLSLKKVPTLNPFSYSVPLYAKCDATSYGRDNELPKKGIRKHDANSEITMGHAAGSLRVCAVNAGAKAGRRCRIRCRSARSTWRRRSSGRAVKAAARRCAVYCLARHCAPPGRARGQRLCRIVTGW